MSEKLYTFLLKLYPDHFRRKYGDEALRLVRDRGRQERGFFSGLRLWLDLLRDLAISLPREYSRAPATPILAPEPLGGERSFQLLAEPPLNRNLLCLSGALSAVLFWGCAFIAAHSGGFPALFPFPLSPPAHGTPVQDEDFREWAGDLAPSVSIGEYHFCVTAKREIARNSVQPLFAFRFARPGAAGVALMDGRVVMTFQNAERVSVRAHVVAGDHQFVLHLDRPVENAFLSGNANLDYCQAR